MSEGTGEKAVRDVSEKRRGIASWSISRPIGTLMITSTLLVLGVVYVGRLPVDLLPRIVYPQVRVFVSNPGVEPAVLEETIAKPLEAALATTEGLTSMRADVSTGFVSITLDFQYGTNVDFALTDASKNVERIRSRLPEEADPPNVNKSDPSQMQIFQVAFSSATRNQIALRQWVDQRLRPQLLSVNGVAAVEIFGGLVREIQVELDPDRLRGYGLSVSQVINALRSENQDLAAGRINTPEREMVGTTAGKFRTVADMKGVLLTAPSGARIPLSEIASVRDTSQEQRNWARLNGVPAVRIGIQKQPEANTVEVVRGVQARLEQLASSGYVPADIKHEVTYDQSGFISDALKSVRDAAIIGAILSMLVVIVFLRSFRKTFIIGVSIPLAILSTFVMMGIADLTLNIMSLGGLALGTGLLLDNAIVMLENIYRRRELEGLDSEEAAHVGAAEVTSPVVASTTTNLASVAPFLLITGLSALIFRELILTISFAILASLPLALTLIPMLAAQLGKVRFSSGLERARPLLAFERGFDRLLGGYRRAATAAVRLRWVMMAGVVGLGVGAWYLSRTYASEFLPQVDDGTVSANVRMPPGATPAAGNRMSLEVEQMISEMPAVASVFANAGAGRGGLDIRLTKATEREMTADQWVQTLQRRVDEKGFAGARVFVRPPRIRGLRTSSSGTDVSVAIVGDQLEQLDEIGNEVVRRLRGIPGLENVQVQADEPRPMLSISLDRERARTLGLDVAAVGQTVRTALDGTIATRYAEGNFEYDVRVLFPRHRFTSTADLGNIMLFPGGRANAPVFLRDVATVSPAISPATIRRENQNRRIEVSGDVITEVAPIGAVTDSIRARLTDFTLPDGYGLIIGGEQEAIQDTNSQMVLIIGLAIFLVFVVLAVQYESLLDPLIILGAVPLALIGVVAILGITGTPFSAPVLLGMIMLAGIVVNNSILVVEFSKHYHRERGVPAEQAVVEAGVVRMRPILMTTFTSLVGAMPLALGLGDGGELMRPLAIAVVGGLAVSSLLTLFVVPGLYVILHTAGDRVKVFVLGNRARRVPASGEVAGD
ncbi:MAG TPA: efflux RND transporter permease subunit [Gemmatimonadaceae bacterium]|nr:efflux RND transporter permease subunit [Gemmatimonadaceae bacterium]